MKNIIKVIIILAILLASSLSLASYITKETNFKYEAGIELREDNQVIENKVFYEIPIGIFVWSSNNRISNCTFINCSDEGIILIGSNNTIENCVFYKCADGVELQKSSNNTFINDRFLSNTHAGIDAIKNNNNDNTFYLCLFYENYYGCFFKESKDNEFIDCTFLDNIVEMKHFER